MARRELRPYQMEDRERILAALRLRRNPLYVLDTGAGKTRVFSEVADIVSSAGWRTVIFTHRWELLGQASRSLAALGLNHGLVVPGRALCHDILQVASIDTVDARLGHYLPYLESIRLAIIDEAHHTAARKYMRVLEAMRRALRLGVTATPYRTDGTGLGIAFDTPIEGPPTRWLIDNGYLAPVLVYAPPLHLDLRNVRISAGDYVPSELAAVLDNPLVTEPAVMAYARLAPGRPCIVFCCTVAHARHVAEQFAAAGYSAAPVDGKMPDFMRDARLKGLADGSLQVLTSCELISEGTDVPAVEVGIMLRPTKSMGLFRQQRGRLTRLSPGKTHGLLIDMVGNSLEHGLGDEPLDWSLGSGDDHRQVPPTRRCGDCFRVGRAEGTVCAACGTRFARRAALPVASDGKPNRRRVLASFSDDQLKTGRYRTLLRMARTVADLERIARAKNYSRGWVRVQARELGIAA